MYKPELLVKFAPELDAGLRYLLWHVSTVYSGILVCSRKLHNSCIYLPGQFHMFSPDSKQVVSTELDAGTPACLSLLLV